MHHFSFWIAAFSGLILDRLTKYWILWRFTLGESRPLIPGILHFTYVENPGAAFSLFSQNGSWLRWLSLVVSLGLGLWALFGPRMTRAEQWGYGFIFAGAFGNGIDRFASGLVVDFIDLRVINFAIFNVADVFINIGLVCLFVGLLKPDRSRPS
jgi:signal peptidase II